PNELNTFSHLGTLHLKIVLLLSGCNEAETVVIVVVLSVSGFDLILSVNFLGDSSISVRSDP
ncbi:7340_t:CDS:2, partial [Entrophospora sp. SA101]